MVVSLVVTALVVGVAIGYVSAQLTGRRQSAVEHAESGIAAYGDNLFQSQGAGTLVCSSGRRVACQFEAAQLRDGHVVLLCTTRETDPLLYLQPDQAEFLEGKTNDGTQIAAAAPLTAINWLAPRDYSMGDGTQLAYFARSLSLGARQVPPATSRYGITNFMFAQAQNKGPLHLTWTTRGTTTEIDIWPVHDYGDKIQRLKVGKHVDVTCEIAIKGHGPESSDQIADDVCYVLSVARGTKVQWIYRLDYDENELPIGRTHCTRVTKRYTPWPAIDPSEVGREDTISFAQSALPRYQELRDSLRLDRGVLDTYLDARTEADFLQLRAAKMAVALVKAAFIMDSVTPAYERQADS